MYSQNDNTLTTLRNTTELVEKNETNGHTIEMLVDAQERGEKKYRTHYIIIDGEWDMTNRRNERAAREEFDATVEMWSF